MKKVSKKTSTKSNAVIYFIVASGLALGFGGGVYLYSSRLEKTAVAPVVVVAKKQTKEEIIKETLSLTGIDQMVFSRTILPKIKGDLLETRPIPPVLTQEDFWQSFQKEEKEKINAIDQDFIELSRTFYNQFSQQELEKYLGLKKLPISNKIQETLAESMKDTISDRETFRQLTDLIKSYLSKNEK